MNCDIIRSRLGLASPILGIQQVLKTGIEGAIVQAPTWITKPDAAKAPASEDEMLAAADEFFDDLEAGRVSLDDYADPADIATQASKLRP